jgi:hypothetical protein
MSEATVAELLTPADAGRILGLTPAGVRLAADDGRLRVKARTPDGGRLFERSEVERFKRERSSRRRAR